MKTIKSMERRFDRETHETKIDTESAISIRFDNQEKVHRKKIVEIDVDALEVAGKTLGYNFYRIFIHRIKSRLLVEMESENRVC
ncbi:hypothetical protein MGH68_17050 [Erysipelothrix sp. D19-032]